MATGYVGYVTPRECEPRGAQEGLLSQVLPDYLIPTAWVVLDEIDRAALPEPPEDLPAEVRYVAPRTSVEAALATVFAEVLGASRVGVRDNFFALGGDSILAIQVVTRARQAGLHLTSRDVFVHQTIAELARARVHRAGRPSRAGHGSAARCRSPRSSGGSSSATRNPERFHQSIVVDFPEQR